MTRAEHRRRHTEDQRLLHEQRQVLARFAEPLPELPPLPPTNQHHLSAEEFFAWLEAQREEIKEAERQSWRAITHTPSTP
jgi:hypothetical protein